MSIITFNDVTKYYGDVRGVEDLSFEVKENEIFGLLGPNGAGKTTTVKIIVRMIKDYKGDIEIFGKNLKEWGKEYYEKIGISFEYPALYSKLTAIDNLSFFGSFYNKKTERPRDMLELVGLEKDSDLTVGGYSKGMKKKLDIARALIHDPDIILFDEPIAGLDPGSARHIKDIILKKKEEEGKTVFLNTHNMTIADELCDRVAFIVDGSVKLIDNPKKLRVERGEKRINVEYESDGRVESSEFPLMGIGDNDEFIKILKEHKIQRMHTLEPNLEEVFLEVTGEELR